MDENLSFDGSQENVVDSQPEVAPEELTNVQETGENEAEPAEQSPVQTAEQNRAFAELRRQADEAKKANDIIAKLYSEPVVIGDKTFAIKNVHDLERAQAYQEELIQRQEYEAKGMDKDLIDKAINDNPTVKAANEILEQQAQTKAFNAAADALFKAFPDLKPGDVPAEVISAYYEEGVPLLTAYKAYQFDNVKTTAEQDAIKSIKANRQKDTGSLGHGDDQHFFTEDQVDKMSVDDVKKNYKDIMKSMKQWKK